jgi:hypothetical protein
MNDPVAWAEWITAGLALATAIANVITGWRHARQDKARFAEHAQRLDGLENGKH